VSSSPAGVTTATSARLRVCYCLGSAAQHMTRKKTHDPIFKVIFHNQGQVYEIYARQVSQGGLFGFIEVEQLLFGERSQIIVDSSEEKLKTEFAGVRRVFIPMHAVVRIDEVDKRGAGRITASEGGSGNLRPFPMPVAPRGEPPSR
jgi:hypothetical protein